MEKQQNKFSLFIILAILFSIYCFIFGDSGLLERMSLKEDKNYMIDRINVLKQENDGLKAGYRKLASGDLSLEEVIKAGIIPSNTRIMFLPDRSDEKKTTRTRGSRENAFVKLEHLRIIWILVSIMILFFYRLKTKKSHENSRV